MVGRLYRTEAIVLKADLLGEADLLVSLLTWDGAKLRAMAWGARKLTSKKMGHLEPLTRVDLALARGRSLNTINQAQGVENFTRLKSNLESISKGICLAELVEGFATEGGTDQALYSLFLDTLRFLEKSPEVDLALPFFELHLLKVSGFMPQLYRCVECWEKVPGTDLRFSVDLGGVLCTRCIPTVARITPLSLQAMKVLRFFDQSQLSALINLRVSGSLFRELRALLDGSVRYWLDREVQAKGFVEHLQQQQERASLRI